MKTANVGSKFCVIKGLINLSKGNQNNIDTILIATAIPGHQCIVFSHHSTSNLSEAPATQYAASLTAATLCGATPIMEQRRFTHIAVPRIFGLERHLLPTKLGRNERWQRCNISIQQVYEASRFLFCPVDHNSQNLHAF